MTIYDKINNILSQHGTTEKVTFEYNNHKFCCKPVKLDTKSHIEIIDLTTGKKLFYFTQLGYLIEKNVSIRFHYFSIVIAIAILKLLGLDVINELKGHFDSPVSIEYLRNVESLIFNENEGVLVTNINGLYVPFKKLKN